MLFKRRHRQPLPTRLRGMVWPHAGLRRSATYVGYRLMRLPGSPYAIAGGFAWGAAVSFTPFIGLHIGLAVLAAWLTRCSVVAAVIGTVIGNPWTFPFIWAWVYTCGTWMLGGDTGAQPPLADLELLFSELWTRTGAAIGWASGMSGQTVPQGGAVDLGRLALNVLLPMTLGAVPNAALAWLVFYLPLRRLVAGYQHRRVERRRKHWRPANGEAN